MKELWELVIPVMGRIQNKQERVEICQTCHVKTCCDHKGHPETFSLTDDHIVLICAWRARDKLSQIKQLMTVLMGSVGSRS